MTADACAQTYDTEEEEEPSYERFICAPWGHHSIYTASTSAEQRSEDEDPPDWRLAAPLQSESDFRLPSKDGNSSFEDQLAEVFDMCDQNHDGTVSKTELIRVFREEPEVARMFGLPKHIRQRDGSWDLLQAVFNQIDRSGDDAITWDEFCQYFTDAVDGNGSAMRSYILRPTSPEPLLAEVDPACSGALIALIEEAMSGAASARAALQEAAAPGVPPEARLERVFQASACVAEVVRAATGAQATFHSHGLALEGSMPILLSALVSAAGSAHLAAQAATEPHACLETVLEASAAVASASRAAGAALAAFRCVSTQAPQMAEDSPPQHIAELVQAANAAQAAAQAAAEPHAQREARLESSAMMAELLRATSAAQADFQDAPRGRDHASFSVVAALSQVARAAAAARVAARAAAAPQAHGREAADEALGLATEAVIAANAVSRGLAQLPGRMLPQSQAASQAYPPGSGGHPPGKRRDRLPVARTAAQHDAPGEEAYILAAFG